MLVAVEAARARSGRKITRKEVEARVARCADKLHTLPVQWIKEARLPALKFEDGKPLGKEAVRYILYRQSRAREMRADIEAKPLYAMIDRKSSGDFAIEIAGTNVNGMTFKGRADRLAWTRGSVCDGGSITAYYKSFPGAEVDAFLRLDGLSMGIEMYDEIELEEAFFVPSGSVKTGSYLYDEPVDDSDDRLLSLGDIPPIVYSEVLGDLRKSRARKKPSKSVEE